MSRNPFFWTRQTWFTHKTSNHEALSPIDSRGYVRPQISFSHTNIKKSLCANPPHLKIIRPDSFSSQVVWQMGKGILTFYSLLGNPLPRIIWLSWSDVNHSSKLDNVGISLKVLMSLFALQLWLNRSSYFTHNRDNRGTFLMLKYLTLLPTLEVHRKVHPWCWWTLHSLYPNHIYITVLCSSSTYFNLWQL